MHERWLGRIHRGSWASSWAMVEHERPAFRACKGAAQQTQASKWVEILGDWQWRIVATVQQASGKQSHHLLLCQSSAQQRCLIHLRVRPAGAHLGVARADAWYQRACASFSGCCNPFVLPVAMGIYPSRLKTYKLLFFLQLLWS